MKYIFTILITITAFICSAQNPDHKIWTFGDFVGLDFHTQPPTPFLTPMYGIESFASECDGQGNLLFYSNGQKLFNSQHVLMPNGDSLLGNQSSTSQGVQVVPLPGNDERYLLFSLAGDESYYWTPTLSGSLYYSVVDMSLNGGLGDIVPGMKNILVDSLFSEHMIVIMEDCKLWLVVHMKFEAAFRCYEITSQGLQPTPVTSYSATVGTNFEYVRGELAYDKVRKHLFLSTPDTIPSFGILEMHDFDPATGVVSNPRLLDSNHIYYRMCISPDASKLYVTGITSPGFSVLRQFDVTLPTAQAIFNSGVTIYNGYWDYLGDIEIGPDSAIYGVVRIVGDSLFTIADPNMPGLACNFTLNAVGFLPGSNTMTGLPSPSIKRFSPPAIPDETYDHDTTICGGQLILTAPDSSYYNYVWSTGDTGTMVSISQPGTYWVTSLTDCKRRVDTFNVMDFEFEPQVHDTIICFASSAVLTAPVSLPDYLWSDGSTGSQITVTQPGTYWVFATDFCIEAVDTFHVSFVDFDVQLPGDTAVCGDILISPAVPVEGASYLWQDGSTGNSFTANAAGLYWVEVSKAGCKKADTMLVDNRALSINLGDDVLLCENSSITLKVQDAGASYTWQDGKTGIEYQVTTAGNYSVYGTNNVCTATDTINVAFEKCDCFYNVPSVFSPNGDGRNDQFQPLIEASCPVSEYSFRVFNRWGEVVFNSGTQGEKWDGKYNGELADIGTYMYLLNFKGAKGKMFFAKGDVTLIR